MRFPTKEEIERIREQYPVGAKVRLISMNDPYTKLKPGSLGRITHVDDIGTVFVRWDSGSGLGCVIGEDALEVIGDSDDR